MNNHLLRYVVAIAEEGSFSKAAKKLYVSQPSLSQSIKNLEKQLNTPIFDRSSYPLTLTHAGELYVKWAKRVLDSEDSVLQQIADISANRLTRLVVGIAPTRSTYLLPLVMPEFQRLCPNCNIILIEKPTSELDQLLESGDIDLLISVSHLGQVRFTSILLGVERILLALPKEHTMNLPISTEEYPPIDLSLFRKEPFILLNEDQLLRKMADSLCAQSGFVPQVTMECRSMETAYAMTRVGVGITFLTEQFVKNGTDGKSTRFYTLKNIPAQRSIAAIYRNDRYLPQAAQCLISLLQSKI